MPKQVSKPAERKQPPANSQHSGNKAQPRNLRGLITSFAWWSKDKDPVVRLTGWLAAWTAVLCVATIALAIIAAIQWSVLARTDEHIAGQLEVMRAGQRAWVAITDVSLRGPLSFSDDTAKLSVRINIKNTGNLPAQVLGFVLHIYPFGPPEPVPTNCTSRTAAIGGMTLFPGDTTEGSTWDFMADNFGGGMSSPLPTRGTFPLFVRGCALYKSAGDDIVHSTQFTAAVSEKSQGGATQFDRSKTYEESTLRLVLLPFGGSEAD